MTEPFQCHMWLLTSQDIKVLAEWVNTILQSEDCADSAVGASSTPSSSYAAAATPQVAPKRSISKRDSQLLDKASLMKYFWRCVPAHFELRALLRRDSRADGYSVGSSHDLLGGREKLSD